MYVVLNTFKEFLKDLFSSTHCNCLYRLEKNENLLDFFDNPSNKTESLKLCTDILQNAMEHFYNILKTLKFLRT